MWGVTVALLLVLMVLWLNWRKKQLTIFKKLGIPGPEPNLLFGNLWEITKKTPLKCQTEWIETCGKVLGYYYGLSPMLMVADIELVKKILVTDFSNFPNRSRTITNLPQVKGSETLAQRLTHLQDKRWKQVRKIMSPSFTSSKLKMVLPIEGDVVDTLLEIVDEKAGNGASFDIHQMFYNLVMDIFSRSALGINPDCQNNPNNPIFTFSKSVLNKSFANILLILTRSFPELDFFWKQAYHLDLTIRSNRRNPITELVKTVKEILQTRRSEHSTGRHDLLQNLIDAGIPESDLNEIISDELIASEDATDDQDKEKKVLQDSEKRLKYMTEGEIVDNCFLFILAGRKTTASALTFTAHFLLRYPEIQEKVRNEIREVFNKEGSLDYNAIQQLQYLDQVLQESMRIYTPNYSFVTRETAEDVKYGSIQIPKGMEVQISSHYIHHDPELWPEPENFDPDRFSPENKDKINPLAYLAFGAGPRNCIAMRFVKMSMKLVWRMLEKYQLLPTEETEQDPLTLSFNGISISPENGVKLRIKRI